MAYGPCLNNNNSILMNCARHRWDGGHNFKEEEGNGIN